jgi:hypothetical protein
MTDLTPTSAGIARINKAVRATREYLTHGSRIRALLRDRLEGSDVEIVYVTSRVRFCGVQTVTRPMIVDDPFIKKAATPWNEDAPDEAFGASLKVRLANPLPDGKLTQRPIKMHARCRVYQ